MVFAVVELLCDPIGGGGLGNLRHLTAYVIGGELVSHPGLCDPVGHPSPWGRLMDFVATHAISTLCHR